MNHPRIDKHQLESIVQLHAQALSGVPENHPMYGEMYRLYMSLRERVDTYDKFNDNPYKTHACKPKFNSDSELDLGEYNKFE